MAAPAGVRTRPSAHGAAFVTGRRGRPGRSRQASRIAPRRPRPERLPAGRPGRFGRRSTRAQSTRRSGNPPRSPLRFRAVRCPRVDAAVNPVVDPVSGEPEFKHTPVRVEHLEAAWHGFVLARDQLDLRQRPYWLEDRGAGRYRGALVRDGRPAGPASRNCARCSKRAAPRRPRLSSRPCGELQSATVTCIAPCGAWPPPAASPRRA